MTITLYRNNSPDNQVSKSLTAIQTITGTPRGEVNILSPSFDLKTTNLENANYMYVEELNRYYFITGMIGRYKDLYAVSTSEDVLMTYKNDILAHEAIVARGENVYNLYLNDGEKPTQQNVNTYLLKFPKRFSEQTLFLQTVGSPWDPIEGGN